MRHLDASLQPDTLTCQLQRRDGDTSGAEATVHARMAQCIYADHGPAQPSDAFDRTNLVGGAHVWMKGFALQSRHCADMLWTFKRGQSSSYTQRGGLTLKEANKLVWCKDWSDFLKKLKRIEIKIGAKNRTTLRCSDPREWQS